ncbi:DUF835 domain-containing protein [Thermococcus sp. Bubb.Bath]|uniref:DUF835 domain-containing protein n=1 Tax=Thermococcus sp. Bubb.Bath TaxID=1638242 RepID=UPI00143AC49D
MRTAMIFSINIKGRSRGSEFSASPLVPHESLGKLVSNKLSSNNVLLITRTHPKLVFKIFRDSKGHLNVVWLSDVEDENSVNPRALYRLEALVENELSKRRSVLVFDGIEYLIIENGLTGTLKFLGKVRDMAALHDSEMYISVSDALGPKEQALIRRVLGLP